MLILGIDPGMAICGYGLVCQKANKLLAVTYGAISTKSTYSMSKRLNIIYHELGQIIHEYRPDAVAVEQLFFSKNVKTALNVGQARGVIMLAVERIGEISILEYTPLQVKQAVVGYGNADKKQVAFMIMRILNIKKCPKPDDVTDALALAICGINSSINCLRWNKK